jgi:hypothetical protein
VDSAANSFPTRNYASGSRPTRSATGEQRALLEPVFRLLKTERYAADAAVEPYPARIRIKGLLRRIVQLCKRHRDIHFADEAELAPLSIIITTLAARSYEQCARNGAFDDEIDLLISVLRSMPDFIAFDGAAWSIPNETTRGENFAEKWNAKPALAAAFHAWHRKASAAVDELQRAMRESTNDTRLLIHIR